METTYTFHALDGRVFTFPNEHDMRTFAMEYALGNLVAEGKIEYVTIDGQLTTRITQAGLLHFKTMTGIEFH